MATYHVTIEARIVKTYTVQADSEEAAHIAAHEAFSVLDEEGIEERYRQDVIDCEKEE